jgi:hypothetical protein
MQVFPMTVSELKQLHTAADHAFHVGIPPSQDISPALIAMYEQRHPADSLRIACLYAVAEIHQAKWMAPSLIDCLATMRASE